MSSDSERLDRNERRNSLAAFLRAIRFRKPKEDNVRIEQDFAQLKTHPRTKRRRGVEERYCVRSAN
jgi:hypothetical protein